MHASSCSSRGGDKQDTCRHRKAPPGKVAADLARSTRRSASSLQLHTYARLDTLDVQTCTMGLAGKLAAAQAGPGAAPPAAAAAARPPVPNAPSPYGAPQGQQPQYGGQQQGYGQPPPYGQSLRVHHTCGDDNLNAGQDLEVKWGEGREATLVSRGRCGRTHWKAAWTVGFRILEVAGLAGLPGSLRPTRTLRPSRPSDLPSCLCIA